MRAIHKESGPLELPERRSLHAKNWTTAALQQVARSAQSFLTLKSGLFATTTPQLGMAAERFQPRPSTMPRCRLRRSANALCQAGFGDDAFSGAFQR